MYHLHNPVSTIRPTKGKHELHDAIKEFDTRNLLSANTPTVRIYPLLMMYFPTRYFWRPAKDVIFPIAYHEHADGKTEPIMWITSKRKIVIRRDRRYYFIREASVTHWLGALQCDDLLVELHRHPQHSAPNRA